MNLLKPNKSGFICHWLISGLKEELYKTDLFNPNQLEFEKELRGIIADDSLKEVPSDIKLGENGLDSLPWEYYQAGNNWFVDKSFFYSLLTKVELYASTVLCANEKKQIKARLWTFEAVDLFVNGKKAVSVKEPVYKPIKSVDFTLDLKEGENHIFVRCQNLGVRDTRNIFGLQLLDDFSDIGVKTEDFSNVYPIIKAEEELFKVVLRDNKLILEKEPSLPIQVEGAGVWEKGAEFDVPKDVLNIKISVVTGDVTLTRNLENSSVTKAFYGDAKTLEERRAFIGQEILKLDPNYDKGSEMNKAHAVVSYFLARMNADILTDGDFKKLEDVLPFVDNRSDCADFVLVALLRIILIAGDKLPKDLYEKIKRVALNFRYWMDEKGSDGMCFWSENHAIGFYACQFMAGRLYPDDIFTRSQRTGKEQWEIGNKRCIEWLDSIEETAFEEFLSPGYMGVTFLALLALIDFGCDEVKVRGKKVLDFLMEIMFMQSFDGCSMGPAGRIYGNVIKPLEQDFQGIYAYYKLNIPLKISSKISTLLTSGYDIPEGIAELMDKPVNKTYQMGNAQVNICKTKDYILTSVASERDENFKGGWSAQEHLLEDPYKTGNFSFMYVKALNEKYHGTTLFQPGVYGYQQHMWSAGLSKNCVVLANHPGGTHQGCVMRPGYWYGNGIMPAQKQWDNILLSVYSLGDKHPVDFTHLYFPKFAFDKVLEEGNWIFGMTNEGMIGVWCSTRLTPYNDLMTDCEYRAYSKAHGYVCVCSSLDKEGSFENFVDRLKSMDVTFNSDDLTLCDGEGHSVKFAEKYNPTQVI